MRARVILLAVVVVGAIGLWWLRPRAEGLLTVAEAQKKVDFPIGTPQQLPAGTTLVGVKVVVPRQMPRPSQGTGLPAEEIAKKRETFDVGIRWTLKHGNLPAKRLTAYFVHPRTPAAEAGIQPGDYVLAINGQSVEKLTAGEVLKRLMKVGNDGQPFTLKMMTKKGARTFTLRKSRYTWSWQEVGGHSTSPRPPQPMVAFLYQRGGRNFNLFQSKVQPGEQTHWAGRVLRENIDINGHPGTLRDIGGHLVLTWSNGQVENELSAYQEGLSAEELIAMARSIK